MGYDDSVLPWQPEVMDALGHLGTDVDLMGPAQAGKSEIGLAWWGWSIDHSPADFLICQPDKAMMQDFVVRRLEPLVGKTPALKDALLDRQGADNIFMKRFGGMMSSHIWPVAAQFRARPVPRGWLDDFDQIPEDIEGQGDAHGLMSGRQTWFEGRKVTFSSSSPSHAKGGGIEARVRTGTCERLHPVCPSCGERFEADIIAQLRFDRSGTPEQAEASAYVECPSGNGCVLPPASRFALLASLKTLPNRGWIAERPAAQRRSFAVDGMLTIRSWSMIAKLWREAEIAWETLGDESALRTFWNTVAGRNYRSKIEGEKKIETADLVPRIEPDWPIGTVPPGVKVVVTSIDVQSNRFEVMATGFGDGLESWLVDRYDITHADDGTPIDPATCPEHWAVLTRVVQRRYPMALDPAQSVPVLTTAIDTHGEKGTTPNAYAWARSVAMLGISRDRLTLVRGGPAAQRQAVAGTWVDEKKSGRGKNTRTGLRLWNVQTSMLKSMWEARLRRATPGPGYVHLPNGFETLWLDELTAEEFRGGKWIKLRPRNETLDLAVYAAAAIMRPPYAQTRSDMNWVPLDFRPPEIAVAATSEAPASASAVVVPIKPPVAAAPKPRAPVRGVNRFTGRSGGGFMQRNA